MRDEIQLIRRLGPDPHENGSVSPACDGCPDIWELEDGDFAIIGVTITVEAKALLPKSAGCGTDESIIRVPRKLLVQAKPDIPNCI